MAKLFCHGDCWSKVLLRFGKVRKCLFVRKCDSSFCFKGLGAAMEQGAQVRMVFLSAAGPADGNTKTQRHKDTKDDDGGGIWFEHGISFY